MEEESPRRTMPSDEHHSPPFSDEHHSPPPSDEHHSPPFSDEHHSPPFSDEHNSPPFSDEHHSPSPSDLASPPTSVHRSPAPLRPSSSRRKRSRDARDKIAEEESPASSPPWSGQKRSRADEHQGPSSPISSPLSPPIGVQEPATSLSLPISALKRSRGSRALKSRHALLIEAGAPSSMQHAGRRRPTAEAPSTGSSLALIPRQAGTSSMAPSSMMQHAGRRRPTAEAPSTGSSLSLVNGEGEFNDINGPRYNLRSTKPTNSQASIKLPWDILSEILSRLPGSTLSRFRFVSTQWYKAITTDPLLAELHLRRGFISGTPSIMVYTYKGKCKKSITLMDHLGRQSRVVLNLGRKYSQISMCYNGVICVYNTSNIMLFNPTIEAKFLLPTPTTGCYSSECTVGYDKMTKQYKVVRFYHKKGDRSGLAECEVYTTGTNRWTQIVVGFKRGWIRDGLPLNGHLYWDVYEQLVAFELHHDVFKLIKYPLVAESSSLPYISALNGSVCVSIALSGNFMVWALSDISSGSWIQLVNLTSPPARFDKSPDIKIDGKFLIRTGENSDVLGYCDSKSGDSIKRVFCFRGEEQFGFRIYNESLVNLPKLMGIKAKGKKWQTRGTL